MSNSDNFVPPINNDPEPQANQPQRSASVPQQGTQPSENPAANGYVAPANDSKDAGNSFDFVALVTQLWKALKELFTGKSEAAVNTITSDSDSAKGKFFWIIAALGNAVVLMVFLLISAIRINNELSEYGGTGNNLFVTALVLPPVFCVVFAAVRGLAIKALFAFRKQDIGFTEAANIGSISNVAAIGSSVIAGLLLLAPTVTFFWWLAAVAAVFCFVYSEILIFTTVQRRGGFDNSVVFTHSWLTAAWFGLTLLITSTAIRSWLESQMTSFF